MPDAAPEPVSPAPQHRALQLISIVLGWGGLLLIVGGVAIDPELFLSDTPLFEQLLLPFSLVMVGAVALLFGALLSAVRAVVVRGALPPERYRGPGIIVLAYLGVVLSVIPIVLAGDDALALFTGGRSSVLGSLLALTATQVGLLAATGVFIVAPRALAGVRLAADGRWLRGLLVGLGLALPAWVVALAVGAGAAWLLEQVGIPPAEQIADLAIATLDPVVVVLAFVLVAPIAEETFFRGVVLPAWEREYGRGRALFGSAALFALIHVELTALLPIFALGLILGWLYLRTRSLLAAIGLHAGFNLLSVGVTLAERFQLIQLPT